MNCRRHGSKPTLALWMLVAAADLAILVAASGFVTVLLVLLGLVVVGGGVLLTRQLAGQRAPIAVRRQSSQAVARRRA